jgi:hypothetical protein
MYNHVLTFIKYKCTNVYIYIYIYVQNVYAYIYRLGSEVVGPMNPTLPFYKMYTQTYVNIDIIV